jgi:prevent-host-death family protein
MTARDPKLQHARPLRDLETDGAKVIEQLRKTGKPVVLTEGDQPAAVLMTAAQFEELTERQRIIAGVLEGIADDEAARTHTTDEVKAAMEEKLGPIPWR